MLFVEGEGIPGTFIRGNNLEIKLKNGNISDFIDTTIKNGFAHHYAFGYNITRNVVNKFCDWLDIDKFFI